MSPNNKETNQSIRMQSYVAELQKKLSSFKLPSVDPPSTKGSASSPRQPMDSVIRPIRISSDLKKRIEDHFRNDKGLPMSSGVRMVLIEYMKQNKLL